jgi:hypothetical protein
MGICAPQSDVLIRALPARTSTRVAISGTLPSAVENRIDCPGSI